MSDILTVEWLKIRRYKPFWVVVVLYPISLAGVLTIALWTQTKIHGVADEAGVGQAVEAYLPFAFPHAWQSVGYLAGWMHFFPAALLILSVTNEFSFRTHRQNLLDGWSRAQFLVAKAALASALCFACTLATAVAALIGGLVSKSTPSLEGAGYLVLFLLQTHVYVFFALALAFTIRRAALALAGFLIYSTILENFAAFLMNRNLNGLGTYLPLEAAGELVPVPFLKEHAPEAAREFLNQTNESVLVLVCLAYLGLFLGLLWARFRREDL